MATVPDNAQRHGQGPIDISLSRTTGALQLTVRDHGPVIVADQLPQLGKAFFKLDAARQRSTGGVRVGLRLYRQVAKALGGELVLKKRWAGVAGLCAVASLTC